MKKKYLRIIFLNMILVLTIGLVGCGSSKNKTDDGATGSDPEIASGDVAQMESTEEITEKSEEETEEQTTEITEEETTEATTEKSESQSGGIDNNGGGNQAPSTTQATTQATTEVTTQATTQATTEATTEATTQATTQATTEATTQADSESESYYMDYAYTVLELVNAERAKVGVAPLSLSSGATTAAKVRAKECATSFSHTRPNGSSCFTALQEAGVSYSCCGENIAAGYWSAESVVEGWVNSPGHYANIIDPNYTAMGLGCYYDSASDYGVYWAQFFIN